MSLADRLKAARNSLGYTQKEMAKAIKTNSQTWQVYESGKSVPGGNVFESLAIMGLNVNWLLIGKGPMWLGEDDLKRLEVEEAYSDLVQTLRLKRNTHKLDSFINHFPREAKLTSEELDKFLKGDLKLTMPQLKELCQFAGGPFVTEEFIHLITHWRQENFEAFAEPQKTSQQIDIELLKEVTTEAEEALFKAVIKLEPVKKAELLALVYDYAAGGDEKRAGIKDQVQRLLRLVR